MKPYVIEFQYIHNSKGYVGVVENFPFEVKRIYYLYDTPKKMIRGGHAHRDLEQILIAVCGSFVVNLWDTRGRVSTYTMARNDCGLYVPPMYWRELDQFSTGAICLALASTTYDPKDYIGDYEQFKRGL
jgi:dTDP-4-dehydrorhamnose 3,5-epimerase-like enzyme